MTDALKIGQLVIFTDLDDSKHISVVLADGMAGYGSDSRIIYVVYLLAERQTVIAYEFEIEAVPKKYEVR